MYGIFDPTLICIFLGDSQVLAELLGVFPQVFMFQNLYMSMFEYATKTLQVSCLETINQFLLKHPQYMRNYPFSRLDFTILLSSQLISSHDLIADMLTVRAHLRFPRKAFLADDMHTYLNLPWMDFVAKLQSRAKSVKDLGVSHYRNLQMRPKKTYLQVESEVQILSVPFAYDFSAGSQDMTHLLHMYSMSHSDKFTNSDWRHIIDAKWPATKRFNFAIGMVSVSYLVVINLSMLHLGLRTSAPQLGLFVAIVIACFSIFHMIPYFVYNIRLFVGEKYFMIEWVIVLFLVLYYIASNRRWSEPVLKLLKLVVILFHFLRSMTLLRILDYFTSLIKIFDTLIGGVYIKSNKQSRSFLFFCCF